MRTRVLVVVMICLAALPVLAQSGAGGGTGRRAAPDTAMIFRSPRPLVETLQEHQLANAWGLEIMFSNYGFGAGLFYRREFSRDLSATASLDISGIKNSDEVSYYDPYTGLLLSPAGKVNAIYMMPVAFGLQYRLFGDAIAETFRPYVNAGVGPTVIMAAPDSLEFFTGIAHAAVHIAPDAFVGVGAYFGRDKRSLTGVNFRYYIIPYKPGVESIRGKPITEFGGFFITLNWGMAF